MGVSDNLGNRLVYTLNGAGDITRTNLYNGLGQRVQQSDGTATTVFSYDEQGKLQGEYTPNNQLIREYIYLGNQPIALISHERPNEILAIHADHLGTPRAVTDSTGTTLWQWEGDAFGDVAPQLETVKMPLRMAGQYHDSATGLFYNYYRYYDPATGRYVRSDPIGLDGGMNTYAYVRSDPLSHYDFYGLDMWIEAASDLEPSLHKSICVGTNAIVAKASPISVSRFCISFRAIDDEFPNVLECFYECEGIVYQDNSTPGKTLKYQKLSPSEDVKVALIFSRYINARVGYNAFTTNCRFFSEELFNRMKTMLGK